VIAGRDTAVPALVYPAHSPRAALVLAHGAGAGQRSGFMVAFAMAIADRGVAVVTFDFPYITAQRKIPDRGPVLEAVYKSVIQAIPDILGASPRSLFIGGKSMGGRIATQVVAANPELDVTGVVLLGYPLHPPGRPETLRAAHLDAVRRPMLFVQGSRDAFGTPSELAPFLTPLGPSSRLHVVDGGDHSLKIPTRDPAAQAAVHAEVQDAIVRWIQEVG
jgi:predicted alpha/beta-hydrolase family hydrolase